MGLGPGVNVSPLPIGRLSVAPGAAGIGGGQTFSGLKVIDSRNRGRCKSCGRQGRSE